MTQRHNIRKTLLNVKFTYWLSLQSLAETCLILRRNERAMIIDVYWCSYKGAVILDNF